MTNTFRANKIVLGEFGFGRARARLLNKTAAEIAREVCREFGGVPIRVSSSAPADRCQVTLPGTDDVGRAGGQLQGQGRACSKGGVDAVLVETCQDILQAKSAIVAALDAMSEKGVCLPIFCTVTVETTGTMLLGTEVAAALTAIEACDRSSASDNCATGPQEMSEHVRCQVPIPIAC